MAAAAPQHNDRPAQLAVVYERSITREIRVLDAKIGKLEVQLNSELEKISSCSGLLKEIIAKPQGSPCSSLRAELDRVRAKRERAYQKLQRKQLEMGIQEDEDDDDDDDDDPANPPVAAVAAGGGGSAPPATTS